MLITVKDLNIKMQNLEEGIVDQYTYPHFRLCEA